MKSLKKFGLSILCFCSLSLTLPHMLGATAPPPQVHPSVPSLPDEEPIPPPQLQIPEEADGPFQIWKEKAKFYVIVNVNHLSSNQKDLDLAKVDGEAIADSFEKLGYRSLPKQERLFSGENANHRNLLSALKACKNLAPPATVLVYYSGHGIIRESEPHLWLQLSGQNQVGPGHGVTLDTIINTPRTAGYKGELIVIVDASISGNATLDETMAFKNLNKKTVILRSSSTKQHSQTLRMPDGQKSAYTHTLLKALGSQWSTADQNADGILMLSELNNFARFQLRSYFQNKGIPELMEPKMIGPPYDDFFIAYQRPYVHHWETDDRQELQILALERALSPSIKRDQILSTGTSNTLGISQRAKLLAQHINSKTEDLYTRGLLALAQSQLGKARTLLAEAVKEEEPNSHKLAKVYLARGRTEVYAGRIRLALVWYKKSLVIQPPEDAKVLNEFGLVWTKAGFYEDALDFLKQALQLREQSLDPMDPKLAVSMNNLAGLYHNLRKYSEAEPLYLRALVIAEHGVGPEHPSLVLQLNNLANLYLDQGKFDKAEPLYQRALNISERSLGTEHSKVVAPLRKLGLIYRHQGRYSEAEPIYQRIIQIDEANLGPTHPQVAFDLNSLALLYREQGKDAESEPLYRRLVEIDEAALGPDHPEVATDLNNLAELYRVQGKYAEAEPLYLRSYDIMKKHFGVEHVKTVTVVNNYLRMLHLSGQVEKANKFRDGYEKSRHEPHTP